MYRVENPLGLGRQQTDPVQHTTPRAADRATRGETPRAIRHPLAAHVRSAWFAIGVTGMHALRPDINPPASHTISGYGLGSYRWVQAWPVDYARRAAPSSSRGSPSPPSA